MSLNISHASEELTECQNYLECGNDVAKLALINMLIDLIKSSEKFPSTFLNMGGLKSWAKGLGSISDHKYETMLVSYFKMFCFATKQIQVNIFAQNNLDIFLVNESLRKHFERDPKLLIKILVLSSLTNDDTLERDMKNKEFLYPDNLYLKRSYFLTALLALLKNEWKSNCDIAINTFEMVNKIISFSSQNQLMLCDSKTLDIIIDWILISEETISSKGDELKLNNYLLNMARCLCLNGIAISALRQLITGILSTASSVTTEKKAFIQELLIHSISCSKKPFYFHFEPAKNALTSRIELFEFVTPFPPTYGYTFLSWIRVEDYGDECNIPILKLHNEKLNIFIQYKTKCLVIITKNTHFVFEGFPIKENTWVHLAIVHHKPVLTNSTVTYYVNGKLALVEKCSYPAPPGSLNNCKASICESQPSSNYKFNLGPTYFIGEMNLDAQTILIIYDVGFNYKGHWQGSWMSNMPKKNRLKHKESSYSINTDKNIGQLVSNFSQSKPASNDLGISEESFLFTILASNSFDLLPATMKDNLLQTGSGHLSKELDSSVVIGQIKSYIGLVGRLEGNVLPVRKHSLEDGIWILGGCSILIKMIEDSIVFFLFIIVSRRIAS